MFRRLWPHLMVEVGSEEPAGQAGVSSRSRSESVQPPFLLGREDFILDVPYKPKKKKKMLRKMLGKLIPFGWSPKEEI